MPCHRVQGTHTHTHTQQHEAMGSGTLNLKDFYFSPILHGRAPYACVHEHMYAGVHLVACMRTI